MENFIGLQGDRYRIPICIKMGSSLTGLQDCLMAQMCVSDLWPLDFMKRNKDRAILSIYPWFWHITRSYLHRTQRVERKKYENKQGDKRYLQDDGEYTEKVVLKSWVNTFKELAI